VPLFRIKGLDPDNTYLYDENPDPERFEEVVEPAPPVKASKPVPAPDEADPAASEENA